MAKTINGIKVGSTTIIASFTDGGVTKTASKTIEVVRAAGSVSDVPVNANAVYGSGSNLCSAGSGTGRMMYRVGSTGEFSYTIPTTSGLNAGTYTLYYYAAQSDSYEQSNTGSISVTIQKATANPTFANTSVSANLSPTNFTTSPAVNCGVFAAATAGHSGELKYTLGTVKNSAGATVNGWSMTSNTSKIITVPASTPGGKYTATVTVTESETSNYKQGAASATITITVNKKNQTAPTASGDTNTYATSGAITGSASGGGCTGNTINYKSDTAGGTNYGTATTTAPSRSRTSVGTTTFIAFWPGNDYWNASSNSSQAKLIVNKANLTVVEVNYSNAYDGSSHSSSIKVTSPNWDGKVIVSGTSTSYGTTVTNAGVVNTVYNLKTAKDYTPSTTIYYKITGGTNYNDYADSVTFKIDKTSGSVSTVPTNAAVTYGSGSNLCSAGSGTGTMKYKLDSGDWSSTIPTATTSVSAGNHTLYYRADESTNYYQSNEGSITVTVARKGVTVSWGTTSWTYDGSAHSTTCKIVDGVIPGTSCSLSLSGNSVGPNVGSETVTASLSNGNYTISSGGSSKTLYINIRSVTYTATNQSWVYDGSSHSASNTATLTSGSLASGHSESFSCSGSVGPNVTSSSGTKTLEVTIYDGNNNNVTSNYSITKNPGTLTITTRPIKITASSASRPYNGSPLTSNSATAEATGTNNRGLVSGHKMTSCTVEGSQTSVGSSANVASGATIMSGSTNVTSNYDITYVNGTLTVTVGTLTVTATPYNATYDGSSHNGITSISAKNQENTAVSPTYTYSTDGTNYSSTMPTVQNVTSGTTIYWKAALTGYTTATGSVSAKVTAKKVTVTGKDASKIYDGTALTLASATVANKATLSGQVSGHTLSAVTCSGSITYVGTANNTPSAATIMSGSTNVTSNYSITYTPGTLTITQATPTITVTGVSQQYTGSSYYAQITKSDAKGTLYWKFGSVPTTSSYGGRTDISSVGTPVGNPSALSTPINVTSVQDVTNQTLYWIFVPSSSLTITTGQTYAANFNNSASGSVTMKITAAAITIPTPTGYTGTYDANSHSATFKSVTGASIAKYRWSLNGSSGWTETTTNPGQTNAGTIYVQASYKADSNHSIGGTTGGSGWSSSATITVNKKEVTVTAGSASRPYNGSALTRADGTTASGLINSAGHIHSLTSYTNTGSITYFGTVDNIPSDAVIKDGSGNTVTSNYAITYAPGKLTITKATPVVSITGVNKDYTGGQFWATATVNAKGTLYWKKGSAPTTSSNNGSVSITSVNTSTNITSVKNNLDDFELYWLFVPSSTANSLTSGHTYAENFTNAGGTSDDHKSLTINPRSISNVTASATSVTYNGSQQTATVSISDTGGNLTSNDYTISGNTGTNATSYTITITGRNNYTGEKKITWTINRRPVTITADSASKTYDGTALTKNSVTAAVSSGDTGIVASHHVHTWTVSGSQTTAGSSYNTVTAATIYNGASSTHGGSGDTTNVTNNYAITFAKGTLTVTARPITYKASDESKVYNGSTLKASNTAKLTSGSLPSGHTPTFTCVGEIGPDVSSGTKTLSGVVIKNGSGVDVSSSFAITKNPGTLEITNASITYANTSPVSEYCTKTAVAATKTLEDISIPIASASATDYSGAAITSGSNPSVEGYTISQSGWYISKDGKTITVPKGVAATTYNITVTAAKPNHTPKENGIEVTIKPVTLTSLEMELNAYEVAYGSSTTVKTLTAKYSNDRSKPVIDDATYSSNPTGIVTIS